MARVWVDSRGLSRHLMAGVGIGCGRRRGSRHDVSGVRVRGCDRSRHSVACMGVGGRRGRLRPWRRRHCVTSVRILGAGGAGGRGGEDQRRERDGKTVHAAAPSMGRTVTTLNIPACICISIWQWKAQSPGASAVRSKVTFDPGATLTVCFNG